ncbi:energy transducer TonB [Marinigracilibium pacificum]|uniref:Energy transducer TonB n=1 Tax=Marinigracilibium pacificum TaxID=2729599 RepID=A0A848J7W9_9BACT|nr:energy transducer TonB [Marinigracilibium pacificum]NMM50479.1 energy transducer TonB [Marinigracilibium pacificum]
MRTLLLLLTVLTFTGFSQSKKQKVQLIDAETNAPIADAIFLFNNGNKPKISDESGFATFRMDSYDIITISHIQYGNNIVSYEKNAPDQIKLKKKSYNLGSLDFNLIDKTTNSIDPKDIWNEISVFQNSAMYKSDINQFYIDINNKLKEKSYFNKLGEEFSYLITFSIDTEGNIENLLVNDREPKNEDEKLIKEMVLSLDNWSPAFQNEKKYSQNFYFKIENKIRELEDEILSPYPQGGIDTFYQYISQNMVYPPAARRMGIQGRVYVAFVIDTNGKAINHRVLRGIGAGCDEEAIRVLQSSPYWIPGQKDDKPTKVEITIPLVFTLN